MIKVLVKTYFSIKNYQTKNMYKRKVFKKTFTYDYIGTNTSEDGAELSRWCVTVVK